MKKVLLTLFSGLVIIGTLCFGAIMYIHTHKDEIKENYSGNYAEKSIVEEKEVKSLVIDCISDDIEFYNSEDGKFHIEYEEGEREEYNYTYDNGVANFSRRSKEWEFRDIFRINFRGKIATRIYIPSTLKDSMDIVLSSGNVDTSNVELDLNKLQINVTSGDLILENIKNLEAMEIHTSSGTVIISKSNIDTANINTTSGDIDITDSTFNKLLSLGSSSGTAVTRRVNVNELRRNATSGDSTFGVLGSPTDYKIKADVTSGDIEIKGQGTNIESEEGLIWGDGNKIIKSNSSSGDFTVIFEN